MTASSQLAFQFLPLGERVVTAAYTPTHHAGDILGLLAWCVSAAGVTGLLIVGTQMAMQLRRGEMGEGATYFRAGYYVVLGCVLAATAGPLVAALGNLSLM